MKCRTYIKTSAVPVVAPLAGAWIEIIELGEPEKVATVAPLAGAWIEISIVLTPKLK